MSCTFRITAETGDELIRRII
ncbi:MAG: hypothetical protein JSV54_04970 [Chloroflexota bacterium]|nr:MAG: hypothetical protein JSV54_04970 [Chloroflexota bacterium]